MPPCCRNSTFCTFSSNLTTNPIKFNSRSVPLPAVRLVQSVHLQYQFTGIWRYVFYGEPLIIRQTWPDIYFPIYRLTGYSLWCSVYWPSRAGHLQ